MGYHELDELGEKFASLSEEEYFEMVKRVAVVSERLKNGYYLTQAIKEIEEALSLFFFFNSYYF